MSDSDIVTTCMHCGETAPIDRYVAAIASEIRCGRCLWPVDYPPLEDHKCAVCKPGPKGPEA